MRRIFWVWMSVLLIGVISATSSYAEELDITRCYSGAYTMIFDSKEIMPVNSWADDGIIMSNSANKILDGAVAHEAGVQRGSGPERIGYGLLKITDKDGDVIIAELPYTGFTFDVKFLEGTGKWKGIKGSLHSERIVANKPGQPAMPLTFQTCRREKGTFELSK